MAREINRQEAEAIKEELSNLITKKDKTTVRKNSAHNYATGVSEIDSSDEKEAKTPGIRDKKKNLNQSPNPSPARRKSDKKKKKAAAPDPDGSEGE